MSAFYVYRKECNVASGLDGEHYRFARLITVGHCSHRKSIGEDKTVETKITSQDSINDRRRERRRTYFGCSRIECGHGYVGGHDGAHAALNG